MEQMLNQIVQYPAFIFDMDGTLLNSEIWHRAAWKKMVLECGGPELSTQELISIAGMTTFDTAKLLAKRHNLTTSAELMTKRKEEIFINEFMPNTEAFPFITDLLKTLHAQGKAVAIATSSPYHDAHYLLTKNNILPHVDALITGDMVKRGKPNPDIYLLAANTIGAQAYECLVFEDTIAGMKGAKNAHMDAIKVFDGHFECERIIGASDFWPQRDALSA